MLQKILLLLPHINNALRFCRKSPTKLLSISSSLLLLSGFFSHTYAQEYTFVVQPVMQPEQTRENYQPLVDYLKKQTGLNIKMVTERNFLNYWMNMKKGKYDLVLDAAHFTDYRAKNLSYSALAKIPDTVTYSLITHQKNLVLDLDELVAKRLTTLPPPSMGATRLLQLFTNPTRQPVIISARSASEAIKAVQTGKSFAAIVPTPMLQGVNNVNVIKTTDPLPHMGFSASSKLSIDEQDKIKKALLNANLHQNGKSLLAHLKIAEFSNCNNATYNGYENLLAGMTRKRTRYSASR